MLKPLYDQVLLKVEEEEDTVTKSGIFIPSTINQEPLRYAEVVAVGEGTRDAQGNLIPMQVRVGDTVMLNRYAGTEIERGQEKYIIVGESSIYGVWEDE
jgi:chaperonin GroES